VRFLPSTWGGHITSAAPRCVRGSAVVQCPAVRHRPALNTREGYWMVRLALWRLHDIASAPADSHERGHAIRNAKCNDIDFETVGRHSVQHVPTSWTGYGHCRCCPCCQCLRMYAVLPPATAAACAAFSDPQHHHKATACNGFGCTAPLLRCVNSPWAEVQPTKLRSPTLHYRCPHGLQGGAWRSPCRPLCQYLCSVHSFAEDGAILCARRLHA
jgi:hypothetical protein